MICDIECIYKWKCEPFTIYSFICITMAFLSHFTNLQPARTYPGPSPSFAMLRRVLHLRLADWIYCGVWYNWLLDHFIFIRQITNEGHVPVCHACNCIAIHVLAHDWTKQCAVYNHQLTADVKHACSVIIYSDDRKMHVERIHVMKTCHFIIYSMF
jgi:hypothetical protein